MDWLDQVTYTRTCTCTCKHFNVIRTGNRTGNRTDPTQILLHSHGLNFLSLCNTAQLDICRTYTHMAVIVPTCHAQPVTVYASTLQVLGYIAE